MIKRAFFYVTRHKGKTLILFLVFLVLSTFVLIGLSILSAADQAALSLRRAVGGSLKLELDKDNERNWTYTQGSGGTQVGYTGTPITDTDVQKILQVEGIRGCNGVGDGSVFAVDFSFIPGFNFGPGSDYSRLPSVSSSKDFAYFRRGAFKLAEGRHINPDDDHCVLISTALAQHNDLQLGDTITVQCCFDGADYPDVSLKIVGMYMAPEDTEFHTTSTDKRNRLIIDHKAMQEIMMRDAVQYDNGVEFFVDDPENMETIANQIEKLDLDWNCFKLTVDTGAYDTLSSSLHALSSLLTGWMIGITAACTGILVLLLHMWIRQRVHETGILLSIGMNKVKIVGQYIIETLMVAAVALGLSYALSGAIAQETSNLLFSQSVQTRTAPEIETPDDGTEYLDITGKYIPYDMSDLEPPERLDVHVTPEQLLWVCLIGLAVCVVAVLLACLPVLWMKPKRILSEMR